MNSKKAITLLVLTTLLMSLVPTISVSAEITNAEVWTLDPLDDGDVGVPTAIVADGVKVVYDDTLTAVGEGVSPKQTIEVYWDGIQPWDGEAGLLNASKSGSDGSFEVWFNVPEALNGDHYIWVRDVSTGETVKCETGELAPEPVGALMVGAYLDFDPSAGLEGDEITINGYGYGDEVEIAAADILINGLAPSAITDEALPCSPANPETNEVGSWTATFDVPDVADGYVYADYQITAEDEDGNINVAADAEFTIGPAVSINVEEGPVGTLVTATGRGFVADGTIASIEITDGITPVACVEDDADDLEIDGDGDFRVTFIIPEVEDDGDYTIEFDDGTNVGEADFEVLGLAGLTFEPAYALQGSTVKIYGYNFTQISGEEVVVSFDGEEVGTFETDRNGEFTGNVKIPGLTAGTYTVLAEQADWNIDNDEEDQSFRIGLVIVILNPEEGPSGTLVSMTGSGFDDANDFNVTFGGKDLVTTKGVPAGGGINEDFTVPTLDPGVYEVITTEVDADGDEVLSVTVEFTVTERTMIETNPLVAPNDYNVTIEGWYFSQEYTTGWDPTLTFVLYNETDDWDLTVWANADQTPNAEPYEGDDVVELVFYDDWDDDGYFKGWFIVPDADTLSLGTYTINCTDENDLLAQFEFTVVDKTVDIEPRKSVFAIGDTVAFNVESSFAQENSYIKIWDPSGSQYWRTDPFEAGTWIEVDTIQRVPYYEQVAGGNPMTLLEDAPIGTWEWTWYDVDDEELDDGSFTVEAAAADVIGEQVADLNNQITDLASQLSDVTSEFDDVKSDIADVAAIAEQAVSAAQQAAEAVQTVAQTANTASQAASDAADAANAAKDAANGLTTLVYGAIGAALVAALAAIVSLMQISRRIAG